MEAAEIIKGLRDKTGMTRKAFSDHLGIPVRTVEDWEKGKRTPPEYPYQMGITAVFCFP